MPAFDSDDQPPLFSPDSKRAVRIVKEGTRTYADETEGRLGPFSKILMSVYSADGSTFIVQVFSADYKVWLYGSGFRIGPFEYSNLNSWLLSEDGERIEVVTYDAESMSRMRTVHAKDGTILSSESLESDDLRMSPDIRTMALPHSYCLKKTTADGLRYFIEVEDKIYGPLESYPTFLGETPDGLPVYMTETPTTNRVLVGDRLVREFPAEGFGVDYSEQERTTTFINFRLDSVSVASLVRVGVVIEGMTVVADGGSTLLYYSFGGIK